jgi:hypothetical protein
LTELNLAEFYLLSRKIRANHTERRDERQKQREKYIKRIPNGNKNLISRIFGAAAKFLKKN